MEIKNLKKAANRILKAIAQKEKIILYGDSDPDGITSALILRETLEILGLNSSKIYTYFPDRETEGYGINEKALKLLEPKAPALFVALDCGVGNLKEVEIAKNMGFEAMIIDHHEVLSKLPKVSIIINPKQKSDKYPFKNLSCAGIVYKLVKFLLLPKEDLEKFLELVAISTIADKMPILDENKELVRKGLLALNQTKRPGLKILITQTGFSIPKIITKEDKDLNRTIEDFRKKILPPLNIWETGNHQSEVYSFLTEKSPKKAKRLAMILLKKSGERKEKIKRIFEKVEKRVANSKECLIFEGDTEWPLVLAGPVASRICQKYKKPTFIFKKSVSESVGSVRVPQGFNAVKALIKCSLFLETYGGHALAAGFRLKNRNLGKFKKCLIGFFS